jgi:hypothetical protein
MDPQKVAVAITQTITFVQNNWHSILGGSMVAGRIYHALTNNGGLRGIFASIWFGTNTPKSLPPTTLTTTTGTTTVEPTK